VLDNINGEMSLIELMSLLKRTDRTKFRDQVLNPLIEAGLVEPTIPDKPTSSKQKYRLKMEDR
jgi:ATP-dependent DNA helicase RecG